ncbi:MAG TPA: RNA methyltransferase [Candidatus Sumerlaeota bacterium]|nr:RNA methyltransferase [Candidatus Sumerlaeota bacterium]
MPIAIALVHYPVYNKLGQVVATSLTNLDIHDIARASRTFGVEPYFIVHAVEEMQAFAQEVITHWTEGFGAEYNVTRKEALSFIEVVPDLATVDRHLQKLWGRPPKFTITSARNFPFTLTYPELRRKIDEEDEPICLVFGTGYGLTDEVMLEADYTLEPVIGPTDYNHLSVRSAVSIILDRLRSIPVKKGL